MRAFLSHSSIDKPLVEGVYKALEKDAAWLDRAEIEWGELFLERMAKGLENSTDFVLFWSASAAKSEWVRLEINMAFILALRERSIRLRVVVLDHTRLPIYLRPYQFLSVIDSRDPVNDVLGKLLPALKEPISFTRAKFVNRHDEFERIEAAVDDPEVRCVLLFGFTGIGKRSIATEAVGRIFVGVDYVRIDVTEGTGLVEFALSLAASSRGEKLPVSLPPEEVKRDIELSLETLAANRRLLVITNVQHWLDEDGEPIGPLELVMETVRRLDALARHPLFLTSTRRVEIGPATIARVAPIHVRGLAPDHLAALIRNWHFFIYGDVLGVEDSKLIAAKLYGHPVAARMAAGMLGTRSAEYFEKYPFELVTLRRDLARMMVRDLSLGPLAERVMETLALAGVPLLASDIAATGFSDEEFQQAIGQCAAAGLVTASTKIEAHPMFQEFFWHRLHRSDYQEQAIRLAEALKMRLAWLSMDNPEYAELLPVIFRLFAMGGKLGEATRLRADLMGELQAAAINLYNRRNYELADSYISLVLDSDPKNWTMRLYQARIRVRQDDWAESDRIFAELSKERPRDVGLLHAKGWRLLRQGKPEEALEKFTDVLSRRPNHVASLRDAADSLHQLGRDEEALQFLAKAKNLESEDAYVFDLESRILESMGKLDEAYGAAERAMARDPYKAVMHHRLGQILVKLERVRDAIPYFQMAVELDSDAFPQVNSLVSAFLDIGEVDQAEALIDVLRAVARTPINRSLVEHALARLAKVRRDYDGAIRILKREISFSRNLLPNLGLLAWVQIAIFDERRFQFPAIADVALKEADEVLQRMVSLKARDEFVGPIRKAISERRNSIE
jgi:tetratricopeptide (TPR) repeat protein